jgi:hypothetical protein
VFFWGNLWITLINFIPKILVTTNELPLKKFEISRDEKTALLKWTNGQLTQINLNKIGTDCIYTSQLKEDLGSSLKITGCHGEPLGVQVQSEKFGDFLVSVGIDGMVLLPPNREDLREDDYFRFPATPSRTKREYVKNTKFLRDHRARLSSARVNMPDRLEVDVNVYISPSWANKFGSNSKRTVRRIMTHVVSMFHHRTLDTQIDMERVRFVNIDKDFFPTDRNLDAFSSFLQRRNIGNRAIHMALTHGESGSLGIAPVMSMCGPKHEAIALVKHYIDDINTAQTVAHEIGHVLGMFHDFTAPMDELWYRLEVSEGRTRTCGPGRDRGGPNNDLLNYELPMASKWSDCSNEDFKNYYARIKITDGDFCLKETFKRKSCPRSNQGCPISDLKALRKKPADNYLCYFNPKCSHISSLDPQKHDGGMICLYAFESNNYEYCCSSGSYGNIPRC